MGELPTAFIALQTAIELTVLEKLKSLDAMRNQSGYPDRKS